MPELVGRTLRSKMILASLLLLTSCADDTQWTLTFTTARTCRFPMQNIHYSFLKKKEERYKTKNRNSDETCIYWMASL